MGSCFKFKGRKKGYSFNNVPYEAAPPEAGTYRLSALDLEGWNQDVVDLNSQNGKVKDENVNDVPDVVEHHNDELPVIMSSPSNSDVTFGEKFDEVKETDDKNNKNKKDKKSKKESKPKKKEKKDKKKKHKKEELNEMETTEVVEHDTNHEVTTEGEHNGDLDTGRHTPDGAGDMETLPRETKLSVASNNDKDSEPAMEGYATDTHLEHVENVRDHNSEENREEEQHVEHSQTTSESADNCVPPIVEADDNFTRPPHSDTDDNDSPRSLLVDDETSQSAHDDLSALDDVSDIIINHNTPETINDSSSERCVTPTPDPEVDNAHKSSVECERLSLSDSEMSQEAKGEVLHGDSPKN